MVEIVFEAHSTSLDNESHLASGWNDVELSSLGLEQSKELGERYKNERLAVIFCSDLQRSYRTAEIAFGGRLPIIKDQRLRECDYGDLTQAPKIEVDREKSKRIKTPFPNGESYEQTDLRMESFLADLKRNYDGKTIMVVGHRATQYGLEHWINGASLADIVMVSWKCQPGWTYRFEGLQ